MRLTIGEYVSYTRRQSNPAVLYRRFINRAGGFVHARLECLGEQSLHRLGAVEQPVSPKEPC